MFDPHLKIPNKKLQVQTNHSNQFPSLRQRTWHHIVWPGAHSIKQTRAALCICGISHPVVVGADRTIFYLTPEHNNKKVIIIVWLACCSSCSRVPLLLVFWARLPRSIRRGKCVDTHLLYREMTQWSQMSIVCKIMWLKAWAQPTTADPPFKRAATRSPTGKEWR